LKETYRSLLDVVSDPRVAETLLQGGVELGGEDRDVSIIFCDICGFTNLSESRQPREVIAILNDHFTPLTQVVTRHGGVVLHFVGDMLIGLFGAPIEMRDHPRRAAVCALELIRERARMNEGAALPVEVSVGVASGHVVAGRMGSRDRLIYSVIGARVNLASRLCSHASAKQVIVDRETLERIGPGAEARALGEVSLKGISTAVPIFELLAIEDPAGNGTMPAISS
jgi:class 3 adenylate cyclase